MLIHFTFRKNSIKKGIILKKLLETHILVFLIIIIVVKMIIACILICCEAGKYKDITSKIRNIEGVKIAFGVHGRWDVVVEIEVPDIKTLSETVLKLHELPGVRATETLIGF